MGYNYLDKEKLQYLLITLRNKLTSTFTKQDTFNAITGGRINENLTNVEYTVQDVSGDEFMPLTALNQHGNLVNAVKEVSSKVANMFSSLPTYFATKQELAVKADKNVYASNSRTPGYGSSGYVAFAKLEVKSSYQDSPIEFELICRGRKESCRVSVQFEGSSTNDPAIKSLLYAGADYGIFARKINTSIWELYYTKSENYDLLTVTQIAQVSDSRIEITHPDTYLSTKPTTNIVNASLGCAVASAETAIKATQDANGNNIVNTYVKKTSILSTFAQCLVSSLDTDIVGAKVMKDISNALNGKMNYVELNSENIDSTFTNHIAMGVVNGNLYITMGCSWINFQFRVHSFGWLYRIAYGSSGWGDWHNGSDDIDNTLSTTSTNPLQNKVITTSLNGKVDKSSVLSTVAECEASTTATDIAGASALAELSDSAVKFGCKTVTITLEQAGTMKYVDVDYPNNTIAKFAPTIGQASLNWAFTSNLSLQGNRVILCANVAQTYTISYWYAYV